MIIPVLLAYIASLFLVLSMMSISSATGGVVVVLITTAFGVGLYKLTQSLRDQRMEAEQ